MLIILCHCLLILSHSIFISASEVEFPVCNCDGDHFWSVNDIFRSQKVSDFLIAAAYFSIPLELIYFVTCSTLFPFKRVVLQFVLSLTLCGLAHLLDVFTYEPPSFPLMLALTATKVLTALTSSLTAVTLLTLIPQLLRVKLREDLLRIKARELDHEVGLMRRKEEASWHVRMLTQEIRKSLDKHTILYTTLVELSKTLELQNCAVWMPNEDKSEMILTHELNRSISSGSNLLIPMGDPEVFEIRGTNGVKILKPESALGCASSGVLNESGAVAAVRMPILKISDFKGGTPQVIKTCYAILVLVLPKDDKRIWRQHELEIIEVVADQVAVALSHAAVLEESDFMRDKLVEQNKVLLQAKQDIMVASEARNSFQNFINQGMKRPIQSILGVSSMMQHENLTSEQKLAIDAMEKTSNAISTLINDMVEISSTKGGHFALEIRPFQLHQLIKEVASITRCLCDFMGFGFSFQVENMVPDRVFGDERRILHITLHIVGSLLSELNYGYVTLRLWSEDEVEDWQKQKLAPWRPNFSSRYSCVRFEITINRSLSSNSRSSIPFEKRCSSKGLDMTLSFNMCKRLVQLMQGNILVVPDSKGVPKSMTLVLRLQLQPPCGSQNYRRGPSGSPSF